MERIAELKDVTKNFGQQKVLFGISLEVHKGEMLLISGPSGSGKSTALRILADLEIPTEGSVKLFGKSLHELSTSQKRQLIADRISYGQQDPALDGGLTVFQNLILSTRAIKSKIQKEDIWERAREISDYLDIDYLLERRADRTLSGGERAKIALGRSLVKRPEILLLDEPTGSVDPLGKHDIFEKLNLIKENEDLSIVVVSHDLNEIKPLSDREIIIDSGLIVN